jgi:hypothetical protein
MEHTVVETAGGSVDHDISANTTPLASSTYAPPMASSASTPPMASSGSAPAMASSAPAPASAYSAASPYSWLYIRERLYAIFSLLWTKKETGTEMDRQVREQEAKNLEKLLEMLENAEEDALNTVKQETSALIDDIMADLQRLEGQCAAILSPPPQL